MPAVLGDLPQNVQQDPTERQGAPSISHHNVIERQSRYSLPGVLTRIPVGTSNRIDRVACLKDKRFLWPCLDAEHRARLTGECFLKPHAFNESGVLDQAKQSRVGHNQAPTRLQLGEVIQTRIDHLAMLINEDQNLFVEWLREDFLVIRCWYLHVRSFAHNMAWRLDSSSPDAIASPHRRTPEMAPPHNPGQRTQAPHCI